MLRVHLATDGDHASITPTPGEASDPLLDALSPLVAGFARLERGPTHSMSEATEVLVGSRLDADRIRSLSRLRAILVPWAGIPRPLTAAVTDSGRRDVRILNIHHNAASAAETAIGLLLSAARGIHRLDPRLRDGDWRPRYEPRPSRRLEGTRAVVLGRGAIGGRIARALRGLGMVVDPVGRPADGGRWRTSELADRIRGSSVLMVAVPALPETEGLVCDRVLDAVRDGIVVNVGRASVLDEAALFTRLADRRLFAAGLDVWWRVPADPAARSRTMPSNLPFHELDHLVLTPHVGGGLGEPGIERARAEALADVLGELVSEAS